MTLTDHRTLFLQGFVAGSLGQILERLKHPDRTPADAVASQLDGYCDDCGAILQGQTAKLLREIADDASR